MAVSSGTATDWLDLFGLLRDFLKSDSTLVTDGENWTQLAGPTGALTNGDEIIMQGPGSSGTDEILVGVKAFGDITSDYFNLGFYGLAAYNPALGGSALQVNPIGPHTINLWNDPIDYWFIANGRRFIVVARVSSNWFCAYCGFALPFTLPSLYPYPLFIGATYGYGTNARWSLVSPRVRNFFDPSDLGTSLMFPDVIWRSVGNRNTDDNEISLVNMEPWRFSSYATLRENIDGSYPLIPAVVVSANPYASQMCALQGVFKTSGFSMSSGSIIQASGVDHLVVPNVFRNGINDFAAIALE